MDEKDGTSGVAHVLEHMMFKGTKKLASGEFNKHRRRGRRPRQRLHQPRLHGLFPDRAEAALPR